jgi:hypothetical protein
MKKIAFALAAVTLTSMAAQAQTTGVAVCDDFLVKYETCVNTKVPAAQQAALKVQVEQLKKTFTDLSKNANSNTTVAPSACDGRLEPSPDARGAKQTRRSRRQA